MANHSTATNSRSNSHMAATIEEAASKTEAEAAHSAATERVDTEAEAASMDPEEISVIDRADASTAAKKDT